MLNNFLNSIDWDLSKAMEAEAKIAEFVHARTGARDRTENELKRVEICWRRANEDLREASILHAEILQKIGEL